MIFTEPRFILFFLVAFGVHWALRNRGARKAWLLLCSYFFYGCWDYRFLALIVGLTSLDYTVALWLGKEQRQRARKWILCASLAANLGVLGFFKYYNFFVSTGVGFLQTLGVDAKSSTLDVILPVGISFITFQTLSYTIDVYRRELEPQREFLDFALFVAFFPQLVAGPIVRARDFLPQLKHDVSFAGVQGRRWLLLFLGGFFKKACLADNLARIVDPVFANPDHYGGPDAVLASILYSVQIYCDFSGYTDMAIATAGLFGYQLTRNFDFPYFSTNIQEFWRRWHISLSTWLRDYLYISLGGGRGGRLRTYRNLMLTMVLGGLWHGANTTFVLWGFLHGLALMVHRGFVALATRVRGAEPHAAPGPLGAVWAVLAWALTFAWVVGCFAIFRAPTMQSAFELFRQFGVFKTPELHLDLWLLLGLVGGVHYLLYRHGRSLLARVEAAPDLGFHFAYGAACAVVLAFMPISAQPFIYFQF
jgi:alginate O-acetyltransferase complex protein AlgI